MKPTDFGTRMKKYEGMEAYRQVLPLIPVMARLDGRSFHTFCRGLAKPYDQRLSRIMKEVTSFLVAETNALMGYTQSDEITLVWHTTEPRSELLFDGRIQKMTSVLAAMATAKFNAIMPILIPEKAGDLPILDCRVWNVPNMTEAANVFLWREQDATRNSVQSAGQAAFSHSVMQGLHSNEVQQLLLMEADINWNDYPAYFKRGTFIQKRRVLMPYSREELERLPPMHDARKNPDLKVERWNLVELDMPPFGRVANRVEVIFAGADPILKTEEQEVEATAEVDPVVVVPGELAPSQDRSELLDPQPAAPVRHRLEDVVARVSRQSKGLPTLPKANETPAASTPGASKSGRGRAPRPTTA